MGKRARASFRAADQKAAASKRRPTNAASRKQHDHDVDARMDALTAEHKRSQPRVTRVDKEDKAARGRRQRAEDEEEALDEVDAFMQQRDRVALNPDDDDQDDDMDDDDDRNARVLDLPDDDEEADEDDEEEGEDNEEDDGEELDEDELYADEPEDAFRPLPVDDILGEDDEQQRQRSLREEERLTTAWGKNKRLYYSADTAEFELESDDEVAKEEEQEADRLMKKQLAQRSEQDYTLAELMALNAATPAGGAAGPAGPASRGAGKKGKSDVVSLFDELGDDDAGQHVEQIERIDAMSERDKLKAITTRAPELVGLMEEMRERVAEVDELRKQAQVAEDGDASSKEERERRAKCMQSVELALQMYVSAGLMYLALRAEGRQLDTHPINQQLMSVRAQLTRLLAVKHTLTGRPLKLIKQRAPAADAMDSDEAEESKQHGEEEDGVLDVDGFDVAESDDVEDEDEDDEDEQKEEPKKPAARSSKVDIFSSLKPATKPTKPSKSTSHTLTAPRPQPHNPFAGLEDDADAPANRPAKKQKVKATIIPTQPAGDKWKSSVDNFDDDDDDLFGSGKAGGGGVDEDDEDEDAMELYNQLQTQQHHKKQAQKQQKQSQSQQHTTSTLSRPPTTIPQPLLPSDHRPISTLMDRNVGLKPSRPKDRKTPKTRNRARYEKALVKRKSQVREYQGQGGVYGGEATGIRRNVAKSVRLKG